VLTDPNVLAAYLGTTDAIAAQIPSGA
jgi:hypothetical protein